MELWLAIWHLAVYNGRNCGKGGVNVVNPEYFLKKYGVEFAQTDSAEEKLRRMTAAFGVHETYEGDKPYIFVSYAHRDSALVLPAIKAIQEKGYPVWYDAGISPGSEWAEDIAQHLKNASLVLAFVSRSAIDSPNCRSEIVYAFGNRKPMLTVRLDKAVLPAGLDMQLSLSQMFDAFAYENGDEFAARLAAAPIFSERIEPVLLEVFAEKRRQAEEEEKKRRQEEMLRQQHAEEARRLAAEQAERERREAEEARKQQAQETERLRLEQEEAERKYQQAKEAARKRREAEEAEEKRWKAEQQQKNRKSAQAEQEEKRRILRVHNHHMHEDLQRETMAGYQAAVKRYNDNILPMKDKATSGQVLGYEQDLCDALYKQARIWEKSPKTKRHAAALFAAPYPSYKDANARAKRIQKQEKSTEIACCVGLPVLYLALNVFASRFVMHLAGGFFLQLLTLLAPAVLVFVLGLVLYKALDCKMDYASFIVLALVAVMCIADPFLMQQIKIWVRIIHTVLVGVISGFLFFLLIGISVDRDKTVEIPKIKQKPFYEL